MFLNLCIGSYASAQYFPGMIDDVRVYNRVLSQKEITRLYKLGEGTKINTSPNAIVDDGLVGHWTFDGKDMYGSTTAYDRSPTHATGTLVNGVKTAIGKFGQGISFDGVDYYINVGSLTQLDNLPALTYSVWVKPVAGAYGADTLTAIKGSGSSCGLMYEGWLATTIGANPRGIEFCAQFSGGTLRKSSALGILGANAWHHVVHTWDGSTSASGVHIYVDGIEVSYSSTQDGSGTYGDDGGDDLLFGRTNYGGSWNGLIDDVRIYNRVLSADEIQKLYNTGAGSTIHAGPRPFACGTETVTDFDGNVYNTVQIGTQCWMKQNMRVGTMVTVATTQTNNGTIEKYCYSDNSNNCTSNHPNHPDGGLYQWDEAMQYSTTPGSRGICPLNWHIPTHDEFTTLERAICTAGSCATDFPYDTTTTGYRGTDEGTKLKPNGTSGFEANLAGISIGGSSMFRASYGAFWSSSESGTSAWNRLVDSGDARTQRVSNFKTNGFSVRCLRD